MDVHRYNRLARYFSFHLKWGQGACEGCGSWNNLHVGKAIPQQIRDATVPVCQEWFNSLAMKILSTVKLCCVGMNQI